MKIRLYFLCLVSILLFNSCATRLASRSAFEPLQKQGVDTNRRIEKLPFLHSAVWQEIKREDYQSIYIPPIATDNIKIESWRNSYSVIIQSEEDYLKEVRKIARYFHEQLIKALSEHSDPHLKIVSSPGNGVVELSLSLTEVDFSNPILGGGLLLVPFPGTSQILSTLKDANASFVAKIIDSQSGLLIASIADKKFPPFRLLDFNKITLSGSIREICNNWAKELADTIYQGHFLAVKDRGNWSLWLW